MRYVNLSIEEIEVLESLQKNSTNNAERERCKCLLLSHQKWTIIDLSNIFNVSRRTIERWYVKWETQGVNSLSIEPGRGVKTRLKGYEKEVSEQLELHNRNLKNVITYFKDRHKIIICIRTLQNFLKDTKL
jgi:transposase